MKEIEIEINGVITTTLSEEEFMKKFIEFLESNDSYFGGGTNVEED